jgi:hypothetical protein
MQEAPDVAVPGMPATRATRQQRAAQAELRRDFPALQVRRGALVADHPPTAVPVPDGATIRSSSVASEGGAAQVAVVAEVAAPVDRVLRFYRSRYARLGFREGAPQPAASGSTTTTFRRAPHSVVVAAHRAGSGTVVSVLALLRTDG